MPDLLLTIRQLDYPALNYIVKRDTMEFREFDGLIGRRFVDNASGGKA